jgi:hypothetical protein
MKNMIRIGFLMVILFTAFSSFKPAEKIYIDEEELKQGQDAFYIHLGENVWIHTNCVHRDGTGLFAYEFSLARSLNGNQCTYEKKWKCPYCYNYWPIGTPCQNKDCPSKYGKGK